MAVDGSGAISTFRIDVTTGALTPVGTPVPTGKNPTAPITIHPNGRFAFTTNDQDATISAFQIDPATGGLTPVPGPPVPAGPTPYTVAIDSTGKFAYVANFGNPETISGYRIDQTTGALSPVDGNPFQSDFHSAPSRGPRAVIATVQ